MIQRDIYTTLFNDKSTSVESPCFYVAPGFVVQAMSFGFMEKASRADATELQVPQVACLQQVLFAEDVKLDVPELESGCGCAPKVYDRVTKILAVEDVSLNGCNIALSSCNNHMLINLPGSYRFVLNDQTALGIVRIYLRMYSADEFPWNSRFFIGA